MKMEDASELSSDSSQNFTELIKLEAGEESCSEECQDSSCHSTFADEEYSLADMDQVKTEGGEELSPNKSPGLIKWAILKTAKVPFSRDPQDCEGGSNENSAAVMIQLSTKEKDAAGSAVKAVRLRHPSTVFSGELHCNGVARILMLKPGLETTTAVVPVKIKEEDEPHPVAYPYTEDTQNIHSPARFETSAALIKVIVKDEEEEEPHLEAYKDLEDTNYIHPPTAHQSETVNMKVNESHSFSQSMKKISKSITRKRHQQIPKIRRAFVCGECEKRFFNEDQLAAHQKKHTGLRRFPCSKCEKIFHERRNLHRHERRHKGERLFPCTECGKSFTEKTNLLQHQRIHTGVKPFKCNECEKSFNQKSNLLQHQSIHTGVRPFHCTGCEKSFGYKSHLLKHQQMHTGEKPFHCTQCEKRFTRKETLQTHQRIHAGVKPFQCTECEKCFTEKKNLLTHIRTHTGEKPFHCPMCVKSFTKKSFLLRHLSVHKIETFTVS